MKKILPFIIAAAGIGGYLYYRNLKNLAKAYTAKIARVSFNMKETQKAAFLKAIFDVNIELNNPSQFTGVIEGIKLDVLVNKKILGTVNKTDKLTINANGTTIIPVQVGLNTLSLYGTLNNAIKAITSGTPLALNIVGILITQAGNINVNENVKL